MIHTLILHWPEAVKLSKNAHPGSILFLDMVLDLIHHHYFLVSILDFGENVISGVYYSLTTHTDNWKKGN